MKRRLHPSMFLAIVIAFASASHAAELKPETVSAWEEYIHAKDAAIKLQADAPGRVADEDGDDFAILRGGEILVAPAGPNMPKRVPHGLIHDWIGTEFIPHATISDVLAALRDYDQYKDVYRPAVIDSKVVNSGDEEDRFSLRLMNQAIVSKKAIDGEYRASYFRIDDHRWYSITGSTRVQEIRDYGSPNERLLPADQGTGLIWRVHVITRFQEQDSGVLMQTEAMVLSRDIPSELRFIVQPIVRRVSRNSLHLSLQQTRAAVQSNLAREGASAKVSNEKPHAWGSSHGE
jgi:hypothetical protein